MQKADIDKLATLARLDMTDSEKEGLLADFGSILTYIDQINSVSVSTSGGDALLTSNVVRPDFVVSSDPTTLKIIAENMPESADGFLKVKQIL